MNKYYSNHSIVTKVYKKMSTNSEMITQMIYGDAFSIIKKERGWFRIKIKEDGYVGFIKKKKIISYIKPTHKICSLLANIYKYPNTKKKIKTLTYGSKIIIKKSKLNFKGFENSWISTNDVKPIYHKNKNIFSNISIFKNTKYIWGGKSYKGIDCSALIQIFFNYNNKYCPRDAKDQVIFFKKDIKLKNIKKNDIIYWKGHVAVALSKKKLIHAYGPMKKTVIMNIDKAIKLIKKTANLEVISIKRI
jgi:hypothetical protein